MNINIAAMVVCVNYTAFLKYTLVPNLDTFNSIHVVTIESDHETRQFVQLFHPNRVYLHVVPDQLLSKNGAVFNKSALIRHVQTFVHAVKQWYVVIDADVVVPSSLRSTLANIPLLENTLYSAPRVNYHTLMDYTRKENGKAYQTCYKFVGYFQCYSDSQKLYAEHSYNCSACDIEFRHQFQNHIMLDHLVIDHLGIDGVHWNGYDVNNDAFFK